MNRVINLNIENICLRKVFFFFENNGVPNISFTKYYLVDTIIWYHRYLKFILKEKGSLDNEISNTYKNIKIKKPYRYIFLLID
jgi:hypothetical protein